MLLSELSAVDSVFVGLFGAMWPAGEEVGREHLRYHVVRSTAGAERASEWSVAARGGMKRMLRSRAGERWGLNSVEVLNSNNRTTVGSANNSRICEAGT